jgi:hypothetical protein
MYLTLTDGTGRTAVEGDGASLGKYLLPGDYRTYMYNRKLDRDVAVKLRVDKTGLLSSQVYDHIDKSDLDRVPVADSSDAAAEMTSKLVSLRSQFESNAGDASEPSSQSVYDSAADDIGDIIGDGGFTDVQSMAPAMESLVQKRNDYLSACDDADYDGDADAAASFESAANMISDLLPEYMND